MPNYNFESLSPIDFELLVRDLLQSKLKITFQSFAPGRDGGIDGLYVDSDQKIIVQSKHYSGSSYSQLISSLKTEVKKVEVHKPTRYIIATSLGLSPGKKEEILLLFPNTAISSSDVYGKDDLNNLLNLYPDVEKKNFKLWFTSMGIFESVLNRQSENLLRDEMEKIEDTLKFFIRTESFNEAIDILDKNHVCIIAGIPGIGKTTLAQMLLLYYANSGHKIIKISKDISEAQVFDYINQKRIFYYDDFLGQTSLSEKLNKNEDQRLLDFIAAIKKSGMSKFILTTREYILNQAKFRYEKLNKIEVISSNLIIDISKYTRKNRAEILFNHLYFSQLPHDFLNELIRNKNLINIIDHSNYNPRLIEIMTKPYNYEGISPKQYVKNFYLNLNNPSEIWKHAFQEQLSTASKNLLLTLCSMSFRVFENDLNNAFRSFHENLCKKFNMQFTPMDFEKALKELDGNFIKSFKSREKTLISFHNPSIRDFIENEFILNNDWIEALIRSSIFFEQVTWLCFFQEEKPKLKASLISYSAMIVGCLDKTLRAPTCHVINRSSGGGEIYNDYWSSSIESRIKNILQIAEFNSGIGIKDFIVKLLDLLLFNLENPKKHLDDDQRKDLVAILKSLKTLKLNMGERFQDLCKKIKTAIYNNLDFPADFSPYCDLKEVCPELFSSDEEEDISDKFKESVYNLDHNNDADLLRQEIEEVREISQRLKIDIDRQISSLEETALELEVEGLNNSEKNDALRFNTEKSQDYFSDEEIIYLFKQLVI